MEEKTLARLGAIVFVALAITATVIEVTRRQEAPIAQGIEPAIVPATDPLRDELTRCQLLALQAQQLADLTAVLAANGRAQALQAAEQATAVDQGRAQRQTFLTPGAGYQPGNVQMFHNSN